MKGTKGDQGDQIRCCLEICELIFFGKDHLVQKEKRVVVVVSLQNQQDVQQNL